MSDGDPIESGPAPTYINSCLAYKLLDGAQATTNGVWVDMRGLRHFTVDVFGTFVGTIQLHASNAAAKPANTEDGRVIGENLAAATLVDAQLPIRWLKAKVTAYTSGSISAFVQGVPR